MKGREDEADPGRVSVPEHRHLREGAKWTKTRGEVETDSDDVVKAVSVDQGGEVSVSVVS